MQALYRRAKHVIACVIYDVVIGHNTEAVATHTSNDAAWLVSPLLMGVAFAMIVVDADLTVVVKWSVARMHFCNAAVTSLLRRYSYYCQLSVYVLLIIILQYDEDDV